MKGLEAIEEKILAEARTRAAEVAAEGDAAVAAVEAAADAEIARLRAESEAQLATARSALDRRSSSAVSLESRRILLTARRDLVAAVLQRAMKKLTDLPAAKKASLYADFLERHGRTGGTVVFGRADLAAGVAAATLKEAAGRPALAGAVFQAGAETHAGSGGIVLLQGEIESNLTFEMLVKQSQDDLESLAAELVMG